jgi:hypothetical protein
MLYPTSFALCSAIVREIIHIQLELTVSITFLLHMHWYWGILWLLMIKWQFIQYVTQKLNVRTMMYFFSPPPLQDWCDCWGSRRLRLLDLLDFRHYERGKVVTLKNRPSLPPGVFLVLIFRGWVDPRAHGFVGSFGKNPQRHHWGSIPRPSD